MVGPGAPDSDVVVGLSVGAVAQVEVAVRSVGVVVAVAVGVGVVGIALPVLPPHQMQLSASQPCSEV